LSKWECNLSAFLDTIPRELQETQQTLSLDNEDGVTTLELLWNPTIEQLNVKDNITNVQPAYSIASTKLGVVATTASTFGPLGILSPAVIAHKIFVYTRDRILG